jgi:hypothetical protein
MTPTGEHLPMLDITLCITPRGHSQGADSRSQDPRHPSLPRSGFARQDVALPHEVGRACTPLSDLHPALPFAETLARLEWRMFTKGMSDDGKSPTL